MAFDEVLADRVRDRLAALPNVSERKMFGGWGLMVDGNLCVGVIGEDLIARVGKDASERALAQPGARAFDFTGKPMAGWVVVAGGALAEDAALDEWIEQSLDFVRTLAPK